jgi:hypothetical protein
MLKNEKDSLFSLAKTSNFKKKIIYLKKSFVIKG